MIIGYSTSTATALERDLVARAGHELHTGTGLAEACDVLFLGGTTPEEVRDEIFGADGLIGGLRAGAILVDRSDSDADSARALAAELAGRGILLVEAPLSGHYSAEAGLAPVTFLAGPPEARAAVRPLIDGEVLDYGEAGKAHALNLFNAAMGLTAHLATLEVAAMGAKFGLGIDAMANVVSKGSGRNRASAIALPRLIAGEPASDMPLSRALHLLKLTTAAGRTSGAPLMLANIACGLVQSAANRFGGEESFEKTVELIESMAAAPLRGLPATPAVQAEDDESELKVGYLGVGTMGGALARRLMLSRPVMVHDVNRDFVDAIVADGATAAADAASLARDCDVIMICVPTSTIVRQAIFGPGGLSEGLAPGKIVIDQTTGNPGETRLIARDLEKLGVRMIDAPVSGGTRGAVAGTIAIIGGGEAGTFARIRPVLEDISPNIVYCGGIGNGHAAKLVQNATAACNRVMTLEGAAAAIGSGLNLGEMIAPIEAGSGWNGGAGRILPALRTGAATTDFAMGLMAKDLRLAMDIGNELGAPMMIANAARALMQTCANEEGMTANLDAIARTVEKMTGLVFADHA